MPEQEAKDKATPQDNKVDGPEPKAPKVKKKKTSKGVKAAKRSRSVRIYPAQSFEEVLKLAEAIQLHASGERVSRLTLLKAMNLSPTSSSTQILITSSAKYGLTKGSYAADYLELTPEGRIASGGSTSPRDLATARCNLGIKRIKPFDVLYERYKGKKLPAAEVMKDTLTESNLEISDLKECIDIFIVNAMFIGLLQTIAGSETLVPVEVLLEQLPSTPSATRVADVHPIISDIPASKSDQSAATLTRWDKICFYATPIGDEGSEQRKHSDLFLNSLIEPALEGFGMEVVRADKIGQPGMITTQILEHLLRSRLVIADLSHHNPNVFYELAIRHLAKLPVVQIIRKADRLPFDVNQVRTIPIDTTDIYTLVPKLEIYQSEIATAVRAALEGQPGSNPVSLFFPGIKVTIPT